MYSTALCNTHGHLVFNVNAMTLVAISNSPSLQDRGLRFITFDGHGERKRTRAR